MWVNGGGLQWASGTTTDISNRLNPLGSAGATFDTNGNDVTLASALSGTATLTKQGAGTLSLSGPNTYNGNTTIRAGTLAVTATGSISGTTNFRSITVGELTGENGTLEIANGGSVSSYSTILGSNAGSTGSADVSGTLSDTNGLRVGYAGNGALTIRATGSVSSGFSSVGSTNGATGTADISGAWIIADYLALGDYGTGTGTLTIRAGGSVSSYESWVGDATGSSGTAHVAGTWTNTEALLLGGAGAGALTIQDSGIVNLNSGASVAYLGDQSGGTGTLNITGSTAAGVLNAASVNGGAGTATLNFNHTDADYHFTTDGAATGTGVAITGSTSVNHVGTGITTLSGTHTYTGATTVSAGELIVNGSTANSAFNITGGRLSGSGTLGQLTLGNGGVLAPGNSPGTLNAGNTTWESGAAFEWEVNDAAGIVSTNWDLLDVTGGLTITATAANPFTINLVSLNAANTAGLVPNFDANADNSWTFVATTTGITFGSGASLGASFALNTSGFQNTTNGTFGLAQDGNDLNITYTTSAVPEPATAAMWLSLSILGFCATRRRARRNTH